MPDLAPHEVYAIRYAHCADRKRAGNFLGGDERDELMPLDYFVWAIKGRERSIVVDAAATREAVIGRGRQWVGSPVEGLAAIGVDAATVGDVVLSHVHWDHAGGLDFFPAATFHIQDREMSYVTGPCMCDPQFNAGFEPRDIVRLVERLFERRLEFHDGDWSPASGIEAFRVGGHTDGMQILRVQTRRGPIVLASDASHFYEHYRSGRFFPFIYDLRATRDGYRRIRELSGDDEGRVIPGHDPLVMGRYPAVPGAEGRVVRLD